MSYKGKSVLITGSCGGLGKAIAEAFLSEGANVVGCDIRKELVDAFEKEVAAKYAENTLVVQCDVTDDSALDGLFEQAEKKFGKLHILVNSAGMMDSFDPVGDIKRSMWDKVVALNLTAAAMVSQRAINSMLKNEVKGSIVNVASIASVRGFCSGVAYTTTKHGLIGLTKNTAAFYGVKAGIRCNAILPGPMHTNIAQNLGANINEEGMAMMWKSYPSEHAPMVELESVAKLVLYISSDAASCINGSTIGADGGNTAH